MKNYKILLLVFLILPLFAFSQDKDKDTIKEKLERPAFESSFIIDNPTNVLFSKNALEVTMQHRFGEFGNKNDLVGFWGASNIRIGLSYAIHERLTIGFGTTKDSRLQDFNWKVALLRQTRSNKVPVSISYYGNLTINATTIDKADFFVAQHRFSYFNQVVIARRFSPNISLQIAPSVSHFNYVQPGMENDRIAVAFGGRIKVSPQTSILFDYSQPITQFEDPDNADVDLNLPGVSLGVEFATSAHAFQLFITNYRGIVPQQNYMYNKNDFFAGDILVGFNITRIYNF